MIIKINGQNESIDKKYNLAELIEEKRLHPDCIVVEHNMRIIKMDEWRKIILNENDNIEIVSFVGGG